MSQANHIQSNFTAGEISPRLIGRSDLAKYYNSAQIIENFHVMKLGGAIRRSGTRFIATQKDQTKVGRLIPFQYNTTQNYILEFGNQTLRFYRTSGQLIDPTPGGSPTEIATPWTESELPDLKFTQSADTMIICHPNYTPRKLARTTGDDSESSTWSLSLFNFTDGPFLDINTSTTTLTPSAKTGSVTITASAATFIAEDGPVGGEAGRQIRIRYDYMDDEVLISNASQTNPIIITTSGDHGFEDHERVRIEGVKGMTQLNDKHYKIGYIDHNSFNLQDDNLNYIDGTVGYSPYTGDGYVAHYPITRLHGWGVCEITAFTNSTHVTASLLGSSAFKRLEASVDWRLGAWSTRSSAILGQGFPACAQYHKGRIWFGRTQGSPQTIWSSKDTSFTSFSPSSRTDDTVTAAYALTYAIDDSQVNAIQWLVTATGGLVIFTNGGPFVLMSGDGNEPISALAFTVTKQGTDGASSRVMPLSVGNVIVYTGASNLQVHELVFKFEAQQFITPDISIFSEHITGTGLTQSAYQQEPNGCLWFVRADGQLVSCTYEHAEEVIAWHRHIVGGTSVVVESAAVIRENNIDQVWLLVKRTINGGTKRYVELLMPQFGINSVLSGGYFSDSHITGSVVGVTSVSGLSHLIGETVAVQINGAVGANAVVSGGGSITIPLTTGVVTAGLPFVSDLVGSPVVIPTPDSRGRLKRPYRVDLLLHNTVGGLISGDNGTNYDLVTYPDTTAGALFSGIRDIAVSDPHQLQAWTRVRQSDPLPMTLLSAITWLDVGGP